MLPVDGTHSGNTGLRWLGWSGDESSETFIRIGLRTSGQPATTERQLRLLDARSEEPIGEPVTLYLNSGDNRIVRLPVPEEHSGPFVAQLEGDPESFDNALYIVKEEPRSITIDYQGLADAPNDPNQAAFYLRKATTGWADPKIDFPLEPANAANDPTATFIVIDGALATPEARALRSRIEAGSHALFLLSNPNAAASLDALLDETGWSSQPIDRSDSRLGSIDFNHPNFDLFADPRFSDFSKIRFYHDFALIEPEQSATQSIARYDDGSPAVLEATIGAGRLAIWVGDWSPQESQWALSSKFVPWLQRLFERSVGGPEQPNALEMDGLAKNLALDESQWSALGTDAFTKETPREPGIYRLREARNERWIALNLPAGESDWERRPQEDWERLGAPLEGLFQTDRNAAANDESQRRLESAVELESQQQLWRWLIIVVAIILAAESLIARRLQNREEGIPA